MFKFTNLNRNFLMIIYSNYNIYNRNAKNPTF